MSKYEFVGVACRWCGEAMESSADVEDVVWHYMERHMDEPNAPMETEVTGRADECYGIGPAERQEMAERYHYHYKNGKWEYKDA
tara:strand:+ start:409 stop:660 length:252 start_codon:yes stop_codon:yes gene_type:complete